MRLFTARRLALAALAPVLFIVSVVPGCSNESEGERCDHQINGDADCASGLVCIPMAQLVGNSADRCCNLDPAIVNDARCARSTGNSGGAGAGGTGGSGGTSGSGGSGAAPDSSLAGAGAGGA
jgi:hypothetical protein